jgi:hypothetical protein
MGDESLAGIWFWVGLLTGVIAYVAAADLWLHAHHHELMTSEFREGLAHPVFGPVLAGLWFAVFIGFTYHFFFEVISK